MESASSDYRVRRFNFRHRYYVGIFLDNKWERQYGKIKWSPKSIQENRNIILQRISVRREAQKPQEAVFYGVPRGRKDVSTYVVEEVVNVNTNSVYYLKFRDGGHRRRILRKIISKINEQDSPLGERGTVLADFHHVRYVPSDDGDLRRIYAGLDSYRAPDFE